MPQIYDTGRPALLPLRSKTCCGFLSSTAGFEPAYLGYNGNHATLYTTEATSLIFVLCHRNNDLFLCVDLFNILCSALFAEQLVRSRSALLCVSSCFQFGEALLCPLSAPQPCIYIRVFMFCWMGRVIINDYIRKRLFSAYPSVNLVCWSC
jgi:hypothetical protein